MSKIISKQKTKVVQPFVPIAESTLEIEIEDLFTAAVPYEIFSEKIQLMEFSDAYWTLKIRCTGQEYLDDSDLAQASWKMNFDFVIEKFPEALKKDCFIKFSCKEANFDKTIPYQPKFTSGVLYLNESGIKTFTVNVVVAKNRPIHSADTVSGQFIARKKLLDNISNTYGDETFSDFTFIVKGKEFKVHKSILAPSSVVMRKLFTADYAEKKNGKCKVDEIEPDIFEALMRFMYSCTVPKNLGDIAYELFAATHYYEIETLKDICVDEIQSSLAKENVTKAYALAIKYGLEALSASAWEIIEREILMIFPPERVNPMPLNEVLEILAQREKEKAVLKKYKSSAK